MNQPGAIAITVVLFSALVLGTPSVSNPAHASTPSQMLLSEEEFTISLNMTHYGTGVWYPFGDATLIVNSDGFSSLRTHSGYTNISISTNLALEAYETMDEEGVFSLGEAFSDPDWSELYPLQASKLSVTTPDTHKSIVFEGNSIAGVMPKTTAILGNIIWAIQTGHTDLLDVSLEISSVAIDQEISEVRVNMTNNNDFVIHHYFSYQPGSFAVVSTDGVSSTDSGLDYGILGWLTIEFNPGDSYDLMFPGFGSTWNTSNVSPGTYVVMVSAAMDDTLDTTNKRIYDYIILEVTAPDESPPSTDITITGTMGENGWYVSHPTITFDAQDDLSEIEFTKYRINESDWESYDGPIEVTDQGIHTFQFFSEDTAGNSEDVQTVEMKCDFTPPLLSFNYTNSPVFNSSNVDITWTCYDPCSGIDSVEYCIDNSSFAACDADPILRLSDLSEGAHSLVIRVYDEAGHNATEELSFNVNTSSDEAVAGTEGLVDPWIIAGVIAIAVALVLFGFFLLKNRGRNIRRSDTSGRGGSGSGTASARTSVPSSYEPMNGTEMDDNIKQPPEGKPSAGQEGREVDPSKATSGTPKAP